MHVKVMYRTSEEHKQLKVESRTHTSLETIYIYTVYIYIYIYFSTV